MLMTRAIKGRILPETRLSLFSIAYSFPNAKTPIKIPQHPTNAILGLRNILSNAAVFHRCTALNHAAFRHLYFDYQINLLCRWYRNCLLYTSVDIADHPARLEHSNCRGKGIDISARDDDPIYSAS